MSAQGVVTVRDAADWGAFEWETSPLPNGTPWGHPIGGFAEIGSMPSVIPPSGAEVDVDSWLTRLALPRKGFRGYNVEGPGCYTTSQWPSPGQMQAWAAAPPPYVGAVGGAGLVMQNTHGRKSCQSVSNQPFERFAPIPPYWYADQRVPTFESFGEYTPLQTKDAELSSMYRCMLGS